jgi:ABC-type nickel/cobalt efflux system permease component RcnA
VVEVRCHCSVHFGCGAAVWSIVPWFDIQRWATGEQRTFQNAMASALRDIRTGDPRAVWTLCSATAAYGFFHALGPGHGKALIGRAALASGATLKRLSMLTVLSSLARAVTVILLVGSLSIVVQMRSSDLADFTETWLGLCKVH